MRRLEPISKSPEEDDEAGELDKTEEVLCVELPADEDATGGQSYPENSAPARRGRRNSSNAVDFAFATGWCLGARLLPVAKLIRLARGNESAESSAR